MVPWFKAKENGKFPVIGIEGETEQRLGFASYGTFRAWSAYRYSVEHSIYVHKEHRCKSLGRTLMLELVAIAHVQNYHLLVDGIEASNATSIALHESLGFMHAGTIREAGYKFEQWIERKLSL